MWPRTAKITPPAAATPTAQTGLWGEEEAARLLESKGYRILGRRVRPDRRDEIDIVARNADTLVFVEVKTRRDATFAEPRAAVNAAKRRALNRAAARYLRRLGFPRLYYRFDVIEVIGAPGAPREARHIENAFPFENRLMLG